MRFSRLTVWLALSIVLAGCSEPLPLIKTSDALRCIARESGEAYLDGERFWFSEKVDFRYRDDCRNHQVEVPAFYVKSVDGDMVFQVHDPETSKRIYKPRAIITDHIDGIELSYGDKVRLSGVLKRRAHWELDLDDAMAVKIELSPEEREKRASYNYVSPEEFIRRSREQAYKDLAKADRELRDFAKDKRQELMEKAIRHETVWQGTTRLDSFELPGNRFVSCRLTQPGPVYTCKERSPK